MRAIVFSQRLFHNGPDALEEIVAQGWLGALGFVVVGDHRASLAGRVIDIPSHVLLYADREPGLERAVYAVRPLAFIGVAVMSVQYRAIVIQKVEGAVGLRAQAVGLRAQGVGLQAQRN